MFGLDKVGFCILSLVLNMTLCHFSAGQTFDPNKPVDGSHYGMYNAGRMADLPQGANRLQLWVVVSQNFRSIPQEDRVARWFHSGPVGADGRTQFSPDPRLRKMQGETAYNYYYNTNPLFAESDLIKAVGSATPRVVLTKADGQVIANLGPATLAKIGTAGECADLLNNGIEAANPVPVFSGQQVGTVLEFEAPGQCGPDGCTPVVTPGPSPFVVPSLPDVVPSPSLAGVAMLGATGVVMTGLAGVLGLFAFFTPGKKR